MSVQDEKVSYTQSLKISVNFVILSSVSSNRISTLGPTLLHPVVEYRSLAPGPNDISSNKESILTAINAWILPNLDSEYFSPYLKSI